MGMNTSFDEKEVGKNKKAFIITRSQCLLPSGVEANLTVGWINSQTKERFDSSGEDFYVYMVDPGFYQLSSLKMTKWMFWSNASYVASDL